MPYFLSDKNLSLNQETEVSGEEARHILFAQRIKKGEKIKLQGPDGKRFLSEVVSADKKSLKILPVESLPTPQEPKVKITLFQSVVSEKALDFIFQKGTELGLNKVVLFNSKNTATKLSADGFKKKQERWNKILMESAKQCERVKWPELEFVNLIEGVLSKAKSCDKILLMDIIGERHLALSTNNLALGLIVGPEGGFTEEEIKTFKTLANLQAISLGLTLLRAETAALAGIATINTCL